MRRGETSRQATNLHFLFLEPVPSHRSFTWNEKTYLDKVDVVLLGLSINVLELSEQHLVIRGCLVEEHHRQVVVPLDQAVQHGNLVSIFVLETNQKLKLFRQNYRHTLDLLLLQFIKHPFDHLVVVS